MVYEWHGSVVQCGAWVKITAYWTSSTNTYIRIIRTNNGHINALCGLEPEQNGHYVLDVFAQGQYAVVCLTIHCEKASIGNSLWHFTARGNYSEPLMVKFTNVYMHHSTSLNGWGIYWLYIESIFLYRVNRYPKLVRNVIWKVKSFVIDIGIFWTYGAHLITPQSIMLPFSGLLVRMVAFIRHPAVKFQLIKK